MGGITKALKNTIGGALGIFGSSDDKTKTPDVVNRDPEKEAREAEEKAAVTASQLSAEDKKKKRQQSLLSTGGEKGNGSSGKTTLGS